MANYPEFYRQSRNYTLVLIAYGVVTLLVTLTLFQPIVDVLFPYAQRKHQVCVYAATWFYL